MKRTSTTKKENNAVQCSLCNHRCTIADGKHGICGVRQNEGGTCMPPRMAS